MLLYNTHCAASGILPFYRFEESFYPRKKHQYDRTFDNFFSFYSRRLFLCTIDLLHTRVIVVFEGCMCLLLTCYACAGNRATLYIILEAQV